MVGKSICGTFYRGNNVTPHSSSMPMQYQVFGVIWYIGLSYTIGLTLAKLCNQGNLVTLA